MKSKRFRLYSASVSGTTTFPAIRAEQAKSLAIQVVWDAAITGTLKLQYSNDEGYDGGLGASQLAGISNLTDVTGSSQATGGAAGNHMWDVETGARWVVPVYTHTAGGPATFTINVQVKER